MDNTIMQSVETKSSDTPGINLPPVIFGTSGLGNLYVALSDEEKLEIIKESVNQSNGIAVFDSAGKYGAGLALETIGKCLKELNVKQENVIISNKLGWVRTPLTTEEPTFEPGVWRDLKYDAVQKISYDGIIECFEQGNGLLNGYIPQMVSVHDPDEYLATATDKEHEGKLYEDILDAYKALYDLKNQGKVKAIGVGAKDWKAIRRVSRDVPLDWVMIANSLTIKNHPQELLDFIEELKNKGVLIINSAVFHAGFLVGGEYFDYKLVTPATHPDLFAWRDKFFELCKKFSIKPAEACVQFALSIPGVVSIALSTTNAKRVQENIAMGTKKIPAEFWQQMKANGLINSDYKYL
ncbi:MAG TPA: aldo/keto reductase [Segetibacter sp.]